jgi:hypothetical protein
MAESWRIFDVASPMTALTQSAARTPAAVATGPAIKAPRGKTRLLQRTNGSSLPVEAGSRRRASGRIPGQRPDSGGIGRELV